jgi:hypothetical protein
MLCIIPVRKHTTAGADSGTPVIVVVGSTITKATFSRRATEAAAPWCAKLTDVLDA